VYVVAGHKGHPQAVAAKGRKGRRARLKGSRGRGTLAKEKPPILGLIQRNGEVIIKLLANGQQDSIKPIIHKVVAVDAESQVFTDKYNIYNRLTEWAMGIRQSIILKVNMPATKPVLSAAEEMGMVFMKSILTQLRGFGLC